MAKRVNGNLLRYGDSHPSRWGRLRWGSQGRLRHQVAKPRYQEGGVQTYQQVVDQFFGGMSGYEVKGVLDRSPKKPRVPIIGRLSKLWEEIEDILRLWRFESIPPFFNEPKPIEAVPGFKIIEFSFPRRQPSSESHLLIEIKEPDPKPNPPGIGD